MVSWWGVALIGWVCFGAGLLFGLVFKSIGARHDLATKELFGRLAPANLMAEARIWLKPAPRKAGSGRMQR